jgi:hypothetical protein
MKSNHPQLSIVTGAQSGAPLIIVPGGFVYLRATDFDQGQRKRKAGEFYPTRKIDLQLYDQSTLTEEEWTLATRIMLDPEGFVKQVNEDASA